MLTHLSINNFAIIDHCSLEWFNGMTVITGETGAGKSIILDALELVLGKRAEKIENAEISAIIEYDNTEYLLKRIFTSEGKSRCFINNKLVTLQELKAFGENVVTLHGQHEHQALLQRETHRRCLDSYAHHETLLLHTKRLYDEYKQIEQEINDYHQHIGNRESRLEFLRFQVNELSQNKLDPVFIKSLEDEHSALLHAKDNTKLYQDILNLLEDRLLPDIHRANKLSSLESYFNEARVQLEEATYEIKKITDNIDINPERLSEIEQQLNHLYDMARKHRLKPTELSDHYARLQSELMLLEDLEGKLDTLQQQLAKTKTDYLTVAQKLSQSRQKAAKKMAREIEQFIHELGMKGAAFSVALIPYDEDQFTQTGCEKIEFLVSANPGRPLQPISKVASGGELSRISLAIDLIAARDQRLPTLIFDEVDVGIGGATATKVGQLLKQLAEKAQVICITHLPQVASLGHHHLHVEKIIEKHKTQTTIHYLNADDKIHEIARMLGGAKITAQTLAHAKELIES